MNTRPDAFISRWSRVLPERQQAANMNTGAAPDAVSGRDRNMLLARFVYKFQLGIARRNDTSSRLISDGPRPLAEMAALYTHSFPKMFRWQPQTHRAGIRGCRGVYDI